MAHHIPSCHCLDSVCYEHHGSHHYEPGHHDLEVRIDEAIVISDHHHRPPPREEPRSWIFEPAKMCSEIHVHNTIYNHISKPHDGYLVTYRPRRHSYSHPYEHVYYRREYERAGEGGSYISPETHGGSRRPPLLLPAPTPRRPGRSEIRRDLEALENDVSRLKHDWRDGVFSR